MLSSMLFLSKRVNFRDRFTENKINFAGLFKIDNG